jgi:hypothetical protein
VSWSESSLIASETSFCVGPLPGWMLFASDTGRSGISSYLGRYLGSGSRHNVPPLRDSGCCILEAEVEYLAHMRWVRGCGGTGSGRWRGRSWSRPGRPSQRRDGEPQRVTLGGTVGRCPAGAPARVCAPDLGVGDDGSGRPGTMSEDGRAVGGRS